MKRAAACSFFCLWALSATAQTYQGPLTFEVAALKAAPPSSAPATFRGGPGTDDPTQLHFHDVSMGDLLRVAYGVGLDKFRLEAPKWIEQERYNVDATVPPGATHEQFLAMLQNLLIDRLAVKAHHETKELQGFALQIAKSGAKLHAPEGGDNDASTPPNTRPGVRTGSDGLRELAPGVRALAMFQTPGGSRISARREPVGALIPNLRAILHAPVVDETALNSTYDFNLTYAIAAGGGVLSATAGGDAAATPDNRAPDIYTALQEQLGLRLVPKKLGLDVVVVDSANRVPSGN